MQHERFAVRFLTPRGRQRLLAKDVPDPSEGAARLRLVLAGIDVLIRGSNLHSIDELRAAVTDLMQDSRPMSSSPDWCLDLYSVSDDFFRPLTEVRSDEAFWDYFLDIDPFPDRVDCAGLFFFARLVRSPERRVMAWLPERLDEDSLKQAMHNLLRVTTAFAVADAGGLLLHSAAFVGSHGDSGESAIVCPGRSGAGKSTLAARARDLDWQILSDELNVLWIAEHGGPPTVEQVPFTGDLGRLARRPGRSPVAAVLPIVRTGRDERIEVSPAEFYARVLSEAVFANSDPQTLPQLEASAMRLVTWAAANDGVATLSFKPEGELEALNNFSSSEWLAAS